VAAQGALADGLAQVREGLAGWQATAAVIGLPHHLGVLAEVLGIAGQLDEALASLAEAMAVVARTGEGFYEAELCRLRGELLLKRSAAHRVSPPRTPSEATSARRRR
jgi:predicted ATPase